MLIMYTVNIIGHVEKRKLVDELTNRVKYERKANIYGVCIKLLTDIKNVKERWEDNFYFMSEDIRSHGRMYVFYSDKYPENTCLYDPLSKTAFLFNFDYYGWIKSIALALASDILEDEHDIYGVHGAAVEFNRVGVAIIAPSGTGKTTHSYLLLKRGASLVSDDWFFVRFYGDLAVAYASEKNFYVREDIAKIWPRLENIVKEADIDKKGRAVINIRLVIGKGKIKPQTTLSKIILLKRDPEDSTIVKKMTANEAINYMVKHDFCNPHQLVRSQRKHELRKWYFMELFKRCETFLVNTVEEPVKVHEKIVENICSSE